MEELARCDRINQFNYDYQYYLNANNYRDDVCNLYFVPHVYTSNFIARNQSASLKTVKLNCHGKTDSEP